MRPGRYAKKLISILAILDSLLYVSTKKPEDCVESVDQFGEDCPVHCMPMRE